MDKLTAFVLLLIGLAVAGTIAMKDPVQVSVTSQEGTTEVIKETLGAQSGPDVLSFLRVHNWFEQGGGTNTIDPVDGTYTLTNADMREYNLLTFEASTTQPALTLTLPASTTFPLSEKAGSYRSWVIENPFTAAATTTTIAAGTGIDLQEPDGQNVVIGINNYAWLTCFRETSSDIVCRADESIPGD